MAAIRLIVAGRVQGVGFRAFVERQALKRGLRGWVRNRRDGTVEALVIGADVLLAEVEEDCRRGPRLSRVDRVERFLAEDDGSTDFRQLPTL